MRRRLKSPEFRLFAQLRRSKLRVTGLCDGNPPLTGGSPHKRPVKREIFDDVIIEKEITKPHNPEPCDANLSSFNDVIPWKSFPHYRPLCEGNPYGTSGFSLKGPEIWCCDIFIASQNKRLNKQAMCRRFETPYWSGEFIVMNTLYMLSLLLHVLLSLSLFVIQCGVVITLSIFSRILPKHPQNMGCLLWV